MGLAPQPSAVGSSIASDAEAKRVAEQLFAAYVEGQQQQRGAKADAGNEEDVVVALTVTEDRNGRLVVQPDSAHASRRSRREHSGGLLVPSRLPVPASVPKPRRRRQQPSSGLTVQVPPGILQAGALQAGGGSQQTLEVALNVFHDGQGTVLAVEPAEPVAPQVTVPTMVQSPQLWQEAAPVPE